MTEPLLEVEDVTIQYQTTGGPITAVSNANFTVEEGSFFGLVGESGSGKSTIAKAIIGGLDSNGEIASGTIRYKGTEIQDFSSAELNEQIRWKEVSYIPQSSMNSLDPLQKVSDKALELAQIHTNMSEAEALDQFQEMFEIVGLSPKRIHEYPHQFSGGMQQRAIIALALFLRPSIVIADEPTTALDVIMQDQIFKYLDNIQSETDTSMLLITHDISVVFESCNDMAVLHAGQVAETGSVEQLFDNPRHPYTKLLQEAFPDIRHHNRELQTIDGFPPQLKGEVDYCAFVERCPWATDECRVGAPPLEHIGETNHRAACIRREEVSNAYSPPTPSSASELSEDKPVVTKPTASETTPVLEIDELHKHFERGGGLVDMLLGRQKEPIRAVDGVSMALESNHVHGVIGESGCGKSTLLKTLIGLHDATDGAIRYKGTPVSKFSKEELKEFRKNVQIIFQDPFNALNPKLTIRESLKEPLKFHNLDDHEERICQALERAKLSPPEKYLDRLPKHLSGGEKQRVSIARAIITEPEVILADEPVSMLDVSTQAGILQLLSELTEEMNMTMLYISHDLSTVSYICDFVHVMYLGRVVESSDTMQILENPKHPYSQALIQAIPLPDPKAHRERTYVDGSPPSPDELEGGCRFKDRCPERMPICKEKPKDVAIGEKHSAACHLYYDHEMVTNEENMSHQQSLTTEESR